MGTSINVRVEVRFTLCKDSGSASSAGIFKQSMGARNRVGIGLSYRPARLNSLAELGFYGIDYWAP